MSTLRVDNIRHNSATSDAITTAADGTCTAKLTSIGGGGLSHRNIIVNGSCIVAQRGTSSTTSGFGSVDRFMCNFNGADEAMTHTQHTLTSSDTGPYAEGFRKSFHVQNGNQTSGAGTTDWMRIWYKIESQDIANSGWNYTSSSSYITLSFWVKTSVAQTYYVQMRTGDGSPTKNYYFTMNLSANTWTKVTHSIPGHADLQFDNDANEGIYFAWYAFRGTGNTGSGQNANQWYDFSSSTITPDQTTTWWTTNDATFEVTGVQLEVGDTATSFEHRSYSDELTRCQRYFYGHSGAGGINGSNSSTPDTVLGAGSCQATFSASVGIVLPVPMRDVPSLYSTVTGSTRYRVNSAGANTNSGSDPVIWTAGSSHTFVHMDVAGFSGLVANAACTVRRYDGTGVLGFSAELPT